jgi:hypothetical protein
VLLANLLWLYSGIQTERVFSFLSFPHAGKLKIITFSTKLSNLSPSYLSLITGRCKPLSNKTFNFRDVSKSRDKKSQDHHLVLGHALPQDPQNRASELDIFSWKQDRRTLKLDLTVLICLAK